MKFRSIKFKISVLYVHILGVILIIYSIFIYISLKHTLYDILDSELNLKVKNINVALNTYSDHLGNDLDDFYFAMKRIIKLDAEYPKQNTIIELEKVLEQEIDVLDIEEDYINLLNLDGETILHSSNLNGDLLFLFSKDLKARLTIDESFWNIEFNRRKFRVITTYLVYEGKMKFILQVGTSLEHINDILRNRLIFFVISIPVILIFASFIGQIFVWRILRPVVEITKTAKNITTENLSERVKAEHIDTEMKYLVDAFNDMIMRLEGSFNYIMQLSTYIAHELKTPLAIIIGESEISLRKRHKTEEYKSVILVCQEEAKRMQRIIDDLLFLTRLDYRSDIFRFENVEFIEFLKEIYEQTRVLALRKSITVKFEAPFKVLTVKIDKLHLRRLFFNIIDNAIKFTPEGGTISIGVKIEKKSVITSVSDTGQGISAEDLPRIFNRFYRGERIGATDEAGTGLGLCIALSIAKIHNGDISVKSESNNGSIFFVSIPLK